MKEKEVQTLPTLHLSTPDQSLHNAGVNVKYQTFSAIGGGPSDHHFVFRHIEALMMPFH